MAQQRNWFLIAGVSLPAVLLLGFFGYTYLARGVVEAPAFDLYFSTYVDRASNQPQHATLHYSMRDERIVVRATPANNVNWNQGIYRLDHETLEATLVEIEIPLELLEGTQTIEVPALNNVRISADTTAPDGYQFRSGYNRGPGLIGAIFYRDRSRSFTIEKLGIVHRIQAPDGIYGYGQAQFLGWVLDDE
jgi:hypothetical protein